MIVEIRGVLRIELASALLVGGHTSPTEILDAATATDDGRPLLPASAVKGALREACYQLARGMEVPACDLVDPCKLDQKDEQGQPVPPCLLCRLFGSPGPDRPLLGLEEDRPRRQADITRGLSGSLRIGDAILPQKAAPFLAERPGVAIDRVLGAAAQRVLYVQQVLDRPGTAFEAPIEGRADEQDWALVQEALHLLTGIGKGRTRGLGEIQTRYVPTEARTTPTITCPNTVPEGGLARLFIEPLEPLVLGEHPPTGTLHRTLTYVPGSTLRGALATAVLAGGCADQDPSFRRLFVNPESCLRFSDAWPASLREQVLPLPVPVSRLSCKHQSERDHRKARALDTLLCWALLGPLVESGAPFQPPACSVCQGPLQHHPGVVPHVAPLRRVVTRLGRDVQTGAAMTAMLYSVEQLVPGQIAFIGTVAGLDAEALRLLRAAGPILLGQGRGKGQGRARVRIEPSHHLGTDALADRRERFLEQAAPLLAEARRLGRTDLPADCGTLVAVMARTDLDLPPEQAADVLLKEIFSGQAAICLAARQRGDTRAGWNEGYDGTQQRTGPRPLRPVVKAGSVWLFCARSGPGPDPAHLARIEAAGVGEHTYLGRGQLIFYPKVLLEGWA